MIAFTMPLRLPNSEGSTLGAFTRASNGVVKGGLRYAIEAGEVACGLSPARAALELNRLSEEPPATGRLASPAPDSFV